MLRLCLLTLLGTIGCVKPSGFVCALDSDCAPGSCEPTAHYCSFDDATCPTGQRYGQYAAGLSNQCTGVLGDAAPSSNDAAVAATGCGKTDAIYDDFDSATRADIWTNGFQVGATYAQNGTRLVFTLPANDAGSHAGYASLVTYDLTESRIFVEAPVGPTAGSGAEMFLELYQDDSNNVKLALVGSTLHFKKEIGGTDTDVSTQAYDPVADRFWQLREAAGIVYWETSPTGAPGSYQAHAMTADPFDLTAVFVELSAGTPAAEANPGTPQFDNLNVYNGTATNGQFCPSASVTDDFSAATPAAVWNHNYTIDGCVMSQGGGNAELVITPATMANSYCSYLTYKVFRLAESSIEVKVTGMVSTSTVAEAYLSADDPVTGDMIAMDQQAGTLRFEQRIGGTYTNLHTITYDPAVHIFWRLRETAGMVTAETSTDGVAWTAMGAAVPDPIPAHWVLLELGAGTFNGATAGSARFQAYNLP